MASLPSLLSTPPSGPISAAFDFAHAPSATFQSANSEKTGSKSFIPADKKLFDRLINLPFWNDHTLKRRWFTIPDEESRMTWSRGGLW